MFTVHGFRFTAFLSSPPPDLNECLGGARGRFFVAALAAAGGAGGRAVRARGAERAQAREAAARDVEERAADDERDRDCLPVEHDPQSLSRFNCAPAR